MATFTYPSFYSRFWKFAPNNLLVTIGVFTGIFTQLNWGATKSQAEIDSISATTLLIRLTVAIGLVPIVLVFLQKLLRRIVTHLPLLEFTKQRYFKYEKWTYCIFLFTVLGAFGIHLSGNLNKITLVVFVFLQIIILFLPYRGATTRDVVRSKIPILFFFSGIAALIYQIVWHRVLYATYGTNIESITIIVTVFMFGLGLGAIIGGKLSNRFPNRIPHLFLLFEYCIGIFGLFSVFLISTVGNLVIGESLFVISISILALLLVPTILMGATLPLLVKYFYQHSLHVGNSAGLMYCVNTLGSAAACFITTDILFVLAGLKFSVYVAATCNLGIGSWLGYFIKTETKSYLDH